MKRTIIFLAAFLLILVAATSFAELDLDQEVIVIPDTHDEKPYIWEVSRNPEGFDFSIRRDASGADRFQLLLSAAKEDVDDVHVFVTDKDFHVYQHVRPNKTGKGDYSFSLSLPLTGKYRVEVIFRTKDAWVNLRNDLKLEKTGPDISTGPDDELYKVKVKFYPEKIYAEHVVTLLYHIEYKGVPVSDLGKINGVYDMEVAAWDKAGKEFLFVRPRQNPGGPEVPVSMVFMRPGRHFVFAEFSHRGKLKQIELVVDVHEEPKKDRYAIPDFDSRPPE
jgi:hypothetical protein